MQHFVDGSTTKYRTGWLDCQLKVPTITSVANGAGCAKFKFRVCLDIFCLGRFKFFNLWKPYK